MPVLALATVFPGVASVLTYVRMYVRASSLCRQLVLWEPSPGSLSALTLPPLPASRYCVACVYGCWSGYWWIRPRQSHTHTQTRLAVGLACLTASPLVLSVGLVNMPAASALHVWENCYMCRVTYLRVVLDVTTCFLSLESCPCCILPTPEIRQMVYLNRQLFLKPHGLYDTWWSPFL